MKLNLFLASLCCLFSTLSLADEAPGITYFQVACPVGYKLDSKSGHKYACIDENEEKENLACRSGYNLVVNLVNTDECKINEKRDVECDSGYRLKVDLIGKDKCEKEEVLTASCNSGYVKRVKSITKDQCQKVDVDVESPKCDLKFGEFQSSWILVHSSGNDYCKHDGRDKGIRSLKCDHKGYGVQVNYSGSNDKCVNESELIEIDIHCPSGYDHKVSGTDTCEKESTRSPACDSGYEYDTQAGADKCQKKDEYVPSCPAGYTKKVAGSDRCVKDTTEDHRPHLEML